MGGARVRLMPLLQHNSFFFVVTESKEAIKNWNIFKKVTESHKTKRLLSDIRQKGY